ncbi:hypothetical protein K488DRAFT_73523, partial [Vararia minispora EC-137]
SNNAFNNIIPSWCGEELAVVSLRVPVHSAELNVLLHAIPRPSMPSRRASMLSHQTLLFSLIMGLTPAAPLDCYALASSQDFYDLAVTISSSLLLSHQYYGRGCRLHRPHVFEASILSSSWPSGTIKAPPAPASFLAPAHALLRSR